jgi:hypothetical protein
LCITAKLIIEWQRWVTKRRTRCEHRPCPRKRTSEDICRVVAFEPVAAIAAIRRTGRYGIFHRRRADHSALMLAARITLPHFSASSSSRLP